MRLSDRPANKAKPNTRFLGRIIKETTNHNAALLAKEAAEAQARLDDLTEAEEKKRVRLRPSAVDIRRRQLGDISSILLGGGQKRKRAVAEPDNKPSQGGPLNTKGKDKQLINRDERRRKEGRHFQDKGGAADGSPDQRSGRQHSHRHHHRDDEETSRDEPRRRHRSRSPTHKERRNHDRRSRVSGNEGEDEGSQSRRKSHSRRSEKERFQYDDDDLIDAELSRRKKRGRLAQDDDETSKDDTSKKADLIRPSRSQGAQGRLAKEDGDGYMSDPLDEFIGPAPPSQSSPPVVRPRGRGSARGAAVMDSRFSEDYNPTAEVQPDDTAITANSWDESVEVFRDRQKWKQQGADRLRATGFTDEEVRKWEKGGEKDIDDVRWSKAGEDREWDRGKKP
ncbi:hypothetical protein B0H63DRAFT_282335 [Podospora didyma]|uniref:Pre-mRNA-splicing factor 38B n=1 Tax=Podospora didyma TaxID=330526 RepID=A0AAE0K9G2_9PEZI|nr:hypothetical protein B0H63DRAFT_282335 [Podospora didyma]